MSQVDAKDHYKAPAPQAPAATKIATKTTLTQSSPVVTKLPNIVVVPAPVVAKPGTYTAAPTTPPETRNITNRYP